MQRLLVGFTAFAVSLGAFAQESRRPAASQKPLEPAYGVATETYVRQSFAQFFPIDPVNNTYHDLLGSNFGRYGTGVGYLIGPHPNIPGGALLSYLELDACDFDDPGYVRLELFACDYLGACGLDPLVDLITTTTGSPGCGNVAADLTPLGYVVDNFLGELVPLVTTSTGSGTTLLSGVIYGYTLQVSPPPPVATFNDVPVGHPQFQFIEALASSGITAGCGAGNFCPNNPLTRGQMAVFLAKALGLHWAGF
jgi:S-layer homology domain